MFVRKNIHLKTCGQCGCMTKVEKKDVYTCSKCNIIIDICKWSKKYSNKKIERNNIEGSFSVELHTD